MKVIKRPTSLSADIHFFLNSGTPWVAIVGVRENGTPYELFTGRISKDMEEDGLYIPKSAINAKIEKVKNKGINSYNLHFENKKGVKCTIDAIEQVFDSEFWNYSRLIAGMLRYEIPPQIVHRIVNGIYEENENISSWKKGVMKVLTKYFPKETIVEVP